MNVYMWEVSMCMDYNNNNNILIRIKCTFTCGIAGVEPNMHTVHSYCLWFFCFHLLGGAKAISWNGPYDARLAFDNAKTKKEQQKQKAKQPLVNRCIVVHRHMPPSQFLSVCRCVCLRQLCDHHHRPAIIIPSSTTLVGAQISHSIQQ